MLLFVSSSKINDNNVATFEGKVCWLEKLKINLIPVFAWKDVFDLDGAC